jgi:hypothetical protein
VLVVQREGSIGGEGFTFATRLLDPALGGGAVTKHATDSNSAGSDPALRTRGVCGFAGSLSCAGSLCTPARRRL